MSIPFKIFYCDSCSYNSTDLCLSESFYYLVNQTKVPLSRKLVWCNCCNQLQPCEDFSDKKRVASQISYYVKELEKYHTPIKSILSHFIRSYFKEKQRLLKNLEGYYIRLSLITERQGSERCLVCGSIGISYFEDRSKLNFDFKTGAFKGSQATGFNHPECGGKIIAKGSEIRASLASKDKPYSREGFKLFSD